MHLDIRWPLGLLFLILGALLSLYGWLTGPLSGENINGICGIAFLLFGAGVLGLALRK